MSLPTKCNAANYCADSSKQYAPQADHDKGEIEPTSEVI